MSWPQLKVQVTPAFAASFATVAMNWALPLTPMFAVAGVMVIASGCPDMVSVTLAARVGSSSEVAVTVTVPPTGMEFGAV